SCDQLLYLRQLLAEQVCLRLLDLLLQPLPRFVEQSRRLARLLLGLRGIARLGRLTGAGHALRAFTCRFGWALRLQPFELPAKLFGLARDLFLLLRQAHELPRTFLGVLGLLRLVSGNGQLLLAIPQHVEFALGSPQRLDRSS